MPSEQDRVAGLLTGQEIQGYGLVESFGEGCLQAASCDLRVGDRHYLYEPSGRWKAVFLGGSDALGKENENFPAGSPLLLMMPDQGGNQLIIPPFGSAIIQLAETVNLFDVAKTRHLLIAGRFDLKLKSIYKGLISQQATQVEPCYQGKLYCFVHNLGAQEVALKSGDKIATIEFSYVGQGLSEEQRSKIIDEAEAHNKDKYTSEHLSFVGKGIKDIRWLHEQGTLPKECGIAPIYQLVNDNVEEAVNQCLEKSDTVDKLAERVGNRLSERQNAFKIVLSLVVAVVTFFTADLLLEVKSELCYFSEELAFFAQTHSPSDDALKAIQAHTAELTSLRGSLGWVSFICVTIIVVLLLVLFFIYMRPMYEQRWEHKRKQHEARELYLASKGKSGRFEQAASRLAKAKANLDDASLAYESARRKLDELKKQFQDSRRAAHSQAQSAGKDEPKTPSE